MTVPERHRRKIAKDTMRLHCAGAFILGGMNHLAAASLLGRRVPTDCNCAERRAYVERHIRRGRSKK